MPKRIPKDTTQPTMWLVLGHLGEYPNLTVACQTVAGLLGFSAESLRRWACQSQIDAGDHHGVDSTESERVRALQQENRELRESNAIVKDAAVFFAWELDPKRR